MLATTGSTGLHEPSSAHHGKGRHVGFSSDMETVIDAEKNLELKESNATATASAPAVGGKTSDVAKTETAETSVKNAKEHEIQPLEPSNAATQAELSKPLLISQTGKTP
jgi:hypothetical protein